MADSRLNIILTARDRATSALKKFGKGVTDVGKKTEGASKKLEGLAKSSSLVEAALGSAAVVGALRLGKELFSLGLEAQKAETALAGMTGGTRQAEAALEAVQTAAGGAIDRLTAAQNATRLFSMGLASTTKEAAELTDIAVTLGATMGKGPTEAMEEFSLLLANQSILRLDTFGISGARVRDRMNELAKAMPNASRETRFLTAVMEEAGGKMAALEAAGFKAVTSVDRFQASIEDIKIEIGSFLADGLLPWIDLLTGEFNQTLIDHELDVRNTAETYADYAMEMERANSASGPLIRNVDLVSEAAFNNTQAIQASGAMTFEWADAIRGVESAAGDAAGQLEALVVGTQNLEAANLGREAMSELNTALEDGLISQEDYDMAARRVMGSLLGMSDEQINANFKLRELNESFSEGTTKTSDYVDQVQRLQRWLSALPSSKHVEILVEYKQIGSGQGIGGFQHGGSFIVGGQGSPDSQLVAFRATPGERVTVDRGDHRQLNMGNVNINNQISAEAFDTRIREWMGL